MRERKLSLPLETKTILLWILVFVVLTTVIAAIFTISTDKMRVQLYALVASEYEFSAAIEKPVGIDDFFVYDSGVAFMVSPNAESRIPAEILMQTDHADYSQSLPWNAENLGIQGIAISRNIAEANGLSTGDTVYSKHLVSNRFTEYTVEQIVSAVVTTDVKRMERVEGIIIMGYDADYARNIAHKIISFSPMDVPEFSDYYGVYPLDLQYRSDAIRAVIKNLMTPVTAAVILAIAAALFQSFLLSRHFKHNYKRLLLLGYPMKNMRLVWNRTFLLIAVCTALTSLVLAMMFSLVFMSGGFLAAFVIFAAQVTTYSITNHRCRIRIERS